MTVSFTANGDPNLADGSAPSGVEPGDGDRRRRRSTTDGSHKASGTVADNVGNVSGKGSLTVQVDATAPTLEVACPATAQVGQGENVLATVTASDGESGLASDPSGNVPIDTSKPAR